jgi:hypothetical protein
MWAGMSCPPPKKMLITLLYLALIMNIFSVTPVTGSPARYIEVQITINTTGGENRFFNVQTGDTLVQVVNPLYTVSSSIVAMFTTKEAFTGSVSGDLSGTIGNGAFNTIWVDITSTSMRGLTVGHADYSDSTGSFSLIMVLDVDAQLSGGNIIVGASLKGYAFSISSSGGYGGKLLIVKLEGSLQGPNTWQFNGKGWIFDESECQLASFSVSASRASSPGERRPLNLMSGDVVMQFTGADITLDANAPAEFTTRQKLTGTSTGALTGSFNIDSNAFIISSGTYGGRGYSVARFMFTGSDGTVDGFLILDNSNYGVHSGYVVGVSGTGAYVNKIFLGSFGGSFTGPPNFYDYSGSGSVHACSIPPPVGGIILDNNVKTISTNMTMLYAYALLIIVFVA